MIVALPGLFSYLFLQIWIKCLFPLIIHAINISILFFFSFLERGACANSIDPDQKPQLTLFHHAVINR